MHFLPTADQLDLQRGVRDVLDSAFPVDALPRGFDQRVWDTLVETGVFAVRTDLGLGLADAALVFEELGRACVPGPVVGTFLAAALTDGAVTVLDPTRQPYLVPHLDVSESILILGARPALAPASGGVRLDDPLDPLTPMHELADVPSGRPIDYPGGSERLNLEGALLTAALQVGLAARLTDLAVGYAKTRDQFDRPIGSFQAIQHKLADMALDLERSWAAVYYAAMTLDADDPDRHRAAHVAKAVAGEAARRIVKDSAQIHGGIGYTWEHDLHLYLRRALASEAWLGNADWHHDRIAELIM
jgi:alkylation response protein AidB-like acyl-CoA dehydrogenase